MPQTFILRFRDLVTEEGGTIEEHVRIIREHHEVWWGWWMRQYETMPRHLFRSVAQRLKEDQIIYIYQLNTGEARLFRSQLKNIQVAPQGTKVGTPEPSRSPTYYHRAKYPAWFLLSSIREVSWHECEFYYDSFPSRPEKRDELVQLLGQKVTSPEQLRHIDVTLWAVNDRGKFSL